MLTTFRGNPVVKLALLTAVAIGGIGLAVRTARADGLDKFTGYTRPGAINPLPTPGEGVNPAKIEPEKTGLGATVYFRVYDLSDGGEGDPWNTGIKNFVNNFVAGKDSSGNHPSRKLDTGARYLYLYQTINDSKRESNVKSTTIRLIVPPERITSWGYFSTKNAEGEALKGVGFSALVTDPAKDHPELGGHIRPASTIDPAADRRTPYLKRAPYELAKQPYGIMPIGIGNIREVALGDNGLNEDPGRDPDTVVLLNSATFDGPPQHRAEETVGYGSGGLYGGGLYGAGLYGTGLYGAGLYGASPFCNCGPFVSRMYFNPLSLYTPIAPLPVVGGLAPTAVGDVAPAAYDSERPLTEEDLKRSAAVRADFFDKPLKPGERSTIFGFTSNYPPVYEDVRLRGNPRFVIGLIGLHVPEAPGSTLTGDGQVPTPIGFEQPMSGAVGSTVGFLGGYGQTGTGGGTGGGLGATGGLPGFGGGLSSGTSGGGGTTGGTGTTPTGVGSTNGTTPTPSTGNVTVTQVNNQHQKQQQQQKQSLNEEDREHEHGKTSHVIPEPAAFLTALFGLPVAYLIARRKAKAKKVVEEEAKV